MPSYAFQIQEVTAAGDEWELTTFQVADVFHLTRILFPTDGMAPYGLVITGDNDRFVLKGVTNDVVAHMDPEIAQKFRDAGYDPNQAADGYQRVWQEDGTYWDYSDADFAERYVDNFAYWEIQPDVLDLQAIDNETLTIRLANGLEHRMPLGQIGGSLSGWRYVQHDGLIFPASDLNITYDAYKCPTLNALRMQLHIVVNEAARRRLQLAWIVFAFSQVGSIASSGGDPDLAERVLNAAEEAQRQGS